MVKIFILLKNVIFVNLLFLLETPFISTSEKHEVSRIYCFKNVRKIHQKTTNPCNRVVDFQR